MKILGCMPVFNDEKYLKESLGSLMNQELPLDTLSIVDDCSNDSSLELLKDYRFPEKMRVILSSNKKKLGAPSSRNKAFQNATKHDCKYDAAVYLDSDIYYEKDYLSQLAKGLHHADIAFCRVKIENKKLHKINFCFQFLCEGSLVTTFALLKWKVASCVQFHPKLEAMQDWEFFLECAAQGFDFFLIDKALMHHHEHDPETDISGKGYRHRYYWHNAVAELHDLPYVFFDNKLKLRPGYEDYHSVLFRITYRLRKKGFNRLANLILSDGKFRPKKRKSMTLPEFIPDPGTDTKQ